MDVAASEFCKDKQYDLDFKNKDSNKADWVSFMILRAFGPLVLSLGFYGYNEITAKSIYFFI